MATHEDYQIEIKTNGTNKLMVIMNNNISSKCFYFHKCYTIPRCICLHYIIFPLVVLKFVSIQAINVDTMKNVHSVIFDSIEIFLNMTRRMATIL